MFTSFEHFNTYCKLLLDSKLLTDTFIYQVFSRTEEIHEKNCLKYKLYLDMTVEKPHYKKTSVVKYIHRDSY